MVAVLRATSHTQTSLTNWACRVTGSMLSMLQWLAEPCISHLERTTQQPPAVSEKKHSSFALC